MGDAFARRGAFFVVAGVFFSAVGFFLLPYSANPFHVSDCPGPGFGVCTPAFNPVAIVAPVSLLALGLALVGGGSYYLLKHRSADRHPTAKGVPGRPETPQNMT